MVAQYCRRLFLRFPPGRDVGTFVGVGNGNADTSLTTCRASCGAAALVPPGETRCRSCCLRHVCPGERRTRRRADVIGTDARRTAARRAGRRVGRLASIRKDVAASNMHAGMQAVAIPLSVPWRWISDPVLSNSPSAYVQLAAAERVRSQFGSTKYERLAPVRTPMFGSLRAT